MIFINQIREKIGVMFGNPETTPGGRALKFYSSCRIDVRRISQIKEGEEVTGQRVRAKVVEEQGGPALPRRRVRHDARPRHQLRGRHPRPGDGPEADYPHRRLVPLRRRPVGPRPREGPRLFEGKSEAGRGIEGEDPGRRHGERPRGGRGRAGGTAPKNSGRHDRSRLCYN